MRRWLGIAAFCGAIVLSSCQLVLTPTGGTTSTCPTGTWSMSSEAITAAVTKLGSTLASNLNVTLSNNGITININNDGTWSVNAHQTGSFTGTLSGQPVTGTGVIDAVAKGTYTKTASTITFTVTSLAGPTGGPAKLTVSGTLGTNTFTNVVFTLPSANSDDDETEIEDAVALVGTAGYTCGSNGTLSLNFSNSHINMSLKH